MNAGLEFLKRFFTFKAFSPDLQNPNLPLLNRIGNKRIALLSIGPCGLKSATLTKGKNGKVEITDIDTVNMRLQEDSADSPFLAALVKKTDCGMVAATIGWKFLLNQDQGKFRNDAELNQELQANPMGVMGNKFRPNTRAIGYLTDDLKHAIIADMEEDPIQVVEDTLANYNLKLIRAQIGCMTLLNIALHTPSYLESQKDTILVVHDQGHILICMGDTRLTVRLFSSIIDIKPPDNQAASTKLTERLTELLRNSRSGKDTRFLVVDSGMPNIGDLMETFCKTSRHDAKITWERLVPEGSDPSVVDFFGLIQN